MTKIPQKTHCVILLNQNNVLPPIRMRSEFAVLLKIRTKVSCQFDTNTQQYACLLLSRQTKNNGTYATFMIRSMQQYAWTEVCEPNGNTGHLAVCVRKNPQ